MSIGIESVQQSPKDDLTAPPQRQKILVLGEDTRSFLSVIRSLGLSGFIVDVVCYNATSPALKSKFIRQAYTFNYQAYTSEQWLAELIKLAHEEHYHAIVPCDERAIYPLHENHQHFPSKTVLAIPNNEVFDHLFDKNTTKALAKKENVPHAVGRLLNLSTTNYQQLIAEFGSKFVIKPTLSFKTDSLSNRQKVQIIDSETSYIRWQQSFDLTEAYLVESFFEGTGEGVSVLALNGNIVAYFAHSRVHEPKTGGGSSYRKSIKLDVTMAEACAKLCKATNYHGVGMFEFKKNYRTGAWILIEVNARFWGSLPLAIFAGVDFPSMYIKALLSNKLNTTPLCITKHGQENYKVGVYARSLINDIFDIKKELEFNLEYSSRFITLTGCAKRLLSFSRILLGKERIDSYLHADNKPFKAEFWQFYQENVLPKLPWNKQPSQAAELKRLLACLKTKANPAIKMVCYGNIMRSPFACNFLQLLCGKQGITWSIDSYGVHQKEQRHCPPECIKTAHKMGVDLTQHKSKWLRQEHIGENDIFFIFDNLNKDKLSRYYQSRYVFNLAYFIPSHLGVHKEIADPYGAGEEAVKKCYELIAAALTHILEQYKTAKIKDN